MHRGILRAPSALAAASLATAPAFAQRAETVSPALVIERDACLLTPDSAIKTDREGTREFFGPLLASLFAGFAGDLVKSGVNAVGEALDVASREQGFLAEGAAAIRSGTLDPGAAVAQPAVYTPREKCLILYVPSGTGSVAGMFTDPSLTRNNALAFDWSDDEAMQRAAANDLIKEGATSLPALYAEAVVLPGKEAFVLRPTLVWYRDPLPGAPRRRAKAELHALFATPAFDAKVPGIGTGFAAARLALPALAPGEVLDWNQLAPSKSVWLPLRPTAGAIDAAVQSLNLAKSAVVTRTTELAKAQRALDAADRLRTRKPGAESDEAYLVAEQALSDSKAALEIAREPLKDKESKPAGATNVQLRLVVIRDANKFGQAVARALKGQAEAAGKGVTEALAPKPEWAASDTAYLTAMIGVEQKQKTYDDAVAAGDPAAITSAGNDLRLAKAKANEAAVTAKKPAPFPGLLAGF